MGSCLVYRRLTVVEAFGPHLRDRGLHHLQSFLVGQLQLLRLFVKLEQQQGLQQAVHLLCNEPSGQVGERPDVTR